MIWSYCYIADFSRQDYDRAYEGLSGSRKTHVDRFRKQADKDRSLAAELLLAKMMPQAKLHRKENGQPYLTGCDLKISIAHSDELVVCALSEEPVGIDAEKMRPIDLATAKHVCTEEELCYLTNGEALPQRGSLCTDPATLLRFYEIWTAKEAYFKNMGTGITNLKSVNILPLKRQLFTLGEYLVQII